jgi:hypothetical protein
MSGISLSDSLPRRQGCIRTRRREWPPVSRWRHFACPLTIKKSAMIGSDSQPGGIRCELFCRLSSQFQNRRLIPAKDSAADGNGHHNASRPKSMACLSARVLSFASLYGVPGTLSGTFTFSGCEKLRLASRGRRVQQPDSPFHRNSSIREASKAKLIALGYPWPESLESKNLIWLETEIRAMTPKPARGLTRVRAEASA